MISSFGKNVLNEKYLIQYDETNVVCYEIVSNAENELLFEFKSEINIISIQFNPLVNNIILVSFGNGSCKIYNILNKSDKEDILFECKEKESIISSMFNIFNPNIVVTLNTNNIIYIWDVRKLYYLYIININFTINKLKFSHYDKNYIEMRYVEDENNEEKICLLNYKENIIKTKQKINYDLNNFLYLKEDILILIKDKQIEKINFINESKIKEINLEVITNHDENLIKDNNILVIMSTELLYFIDILSFTIIDQIEFLDTNINFFYIKEDYEIGLKYIYRQGLVMEKFFNINNKLVKLKEKEDLINIKNNFYEHFYHKILKYMCLLNFNENTDSKQEHIKNYMNIKEIIDFFNKVKEINIFIRRDFVTQLFNENIIDEPINNDELNNNKFSNIRRYIKILNIVDVESRKDNLIKELKKDIDKNSIFKLYIEIVKLLTIDNTNKKLLEIYLLFLNLYENLLLENYTKKNIEKYKNEVKYYSVCFNKDEYKIFFNEDKTNEKEVLLEFLNKANKLNNFKYNNPEFQKFLDEYKDKLTDFQDFNQPIEYDFYNDELKWFMLKMQTFITFNNLKSKKDNQILLEDMKLGLKTVLKYNLLENENIIKNKFTLKSVLYLIICPCSSMDKDKPLDFFCNSLLSKRNDIKELKNKYKIIKGNQLEYENEIYDNIEDICIKNLPYKNYSQEEKYNFNFLLNNYVKSKDKIKEFLSKILKKNIFKEIYSILFGNENYKLLDERYLKELIMNRLDFVPIRPNGAVAISDEISLDTFISTKKNVVIQNESSNIALNDLKEILNTSSYILSEEHEIFHLLNCIPYYENNCSLSIDTPRKNKFEEIKEGGVYLELLLFGREIKKITLADALFILNEENYDKSLGDFVTSFENKKEEDLKIKGVFSDFNKHIDLQKMLISKMDSSYLEHKSKYNTNLLDDCYIIKNLENDVVGKIYK